MGRCQRGPCPGRRKPLGTHTQGRIQAAVVVSSGIDREWSAASPPSGGYACSLKLSAPSHTAPFCLMP